MTREEMQLKCLMKVLPGLVEIKKLSTYSLQFVFGDGEVLNYTGSTPSEGWPSDYVRSALGSVAGRRFLINHAFGCDKLEDITKDEVQTALDDEIEHTFVNATFN